MKKIVLMVAALPVCFSFAQLPERPGADFKPRPDRSNIEIKKAELKADLDAEPAGEPTGRLTVSEFLLKRNELKGQVIELIFDKVVSLKQVGNEGYMAVVTYESPRMVEGLNILVSADGLKFFEELSKPEIRRTETVYIQVLKPGVVKAIGTRYRKDAEEGERYRW